MSDTGLSDFAGATPASTPEQLRAEQAALRAAQGQGQGQPAPFGQQPQPPVGYLTQEQVQVQIEAARAQEREKLYPQLGAVDTLRQELDELKAAREAEQAERQRLLDEAEAARVAAEESAMSKTALNEKRTSELAAELAELRAETARKDAVFEQERRFGALQEYARGKITAAEGTIIPELYDMVSGNTEAEIDASIAMLQTKSQRMIGDLQATLVMQRQGMAGTMPTGTPSIGGPMENETGQRQFSAEEIGAMSPTEFARHRSQLLHASGVAYRQTRG